jgi:hypothetical protein
MQDTPKNWIIDNMSQKHTPNLEKLPKRNNWKGLQEKGCVFTVQGVQVFVFLCTFSVLVLGDTSQLRFGPPPPPPPPPLNLKQNFALGRH